MASRTGSRTTDKAAPAPTKTSKAGVKSKPSPAKAAETTRKTATPATATPAAAKPSTATPEAAAVTTAKPTAPAAAPAAAAPAVAKPVAAAPAAAPAETARAAVAAKTRKADSGARPATHVSPEERHRLVAMAAYYIAERRGFSGGDDMDDWLQAEAEVDRMLQSGAI